MVEGFVFENSFGLGEAWSLYNNEMISNREWNLYDLSQLREYEVSGAGDCVGIESENYAHIDISAMPMSKVYNSNCGWQTVRKKKSNLC